MKIIEQWLPDVDFSRPAADEITGLLVPIPSTYGMSIDQATSVLEDAGFTVAVGGEIDSQLDRGLVAGSYPRSGDSTSSGDTVTIYPSDGSPYVAPPSRSPRRRAAATAADAADLTARHRTRRRVRRRTGGAAPPACSRTPPRPARSGSRIDAGSVAPHPGSSADPDHGVDAAHGEQGAQRSRLQADEQPEPPGHRDQRHHDPDAGDREVALHARGLGPGRRPCAARSRGHREVASCSAATAPAAMIAERTDFLRIECTPTSIVPLDGGAETVPGPQYRPREGAQAPSWRRTSAATLPPSARPLTCGWTTPITLPIARMPSPAAPVCSTAAADDVGDLVVAELGRQVVGEHRRLGPLLLRHLRAAALVERGGGLAALLGLGGEHPDDVVVGELDLLLAGDLRVGDRGQHHPQRRRPHLVARLDRGGEVGAETVLESTHDRHCGSLAAWPPPRALRRSAASAPLAGLATLGVRRRGGPRLHAAAGRRSRCCARARRRCGCCTSRDLHLTPGQRRKQDVGARPGPARARPGRRHRRQPRPTATRCPSSSTRSAALLDVPGRLRVRLQRLLRADAAQPAALPAPRRRQARTPTSPQLPWRDLRAAFAAAGWLDLTNTSGAWRSAGRPFAFAGVDDPHLGFDDLRAVAGPADRRTPTCGSASRTRRTSGCSTSSPRDGYDAILAGHTHGGQVCLPVLGALTTNCDLDTARAKGLHRHPADSRPGDPGSTWLHVSAGLGTSPYARIRGRLPPRGHPAHADRTPGVSATASFGLSRNATRYSTATTSSRLR